MQKNLVIVESPAKAKTIEKFLGKNYKVIASVGHIRDLPKSSLGIDIDNNFEPKYITIRGKGPVIKSLKDEAKKSKAIYLATDPDREGEAISWHLSTILGLEEKDKVRVEFNEITKDSVQSAIKNPRMIDTDLVDAQQARRVLDRLVGYKISPLLWRKIRKGLSAGRVQSVAVKLICKREEDIINFVPQEYWSIKADLIKDKKTFQADFYGERIEGKEKKIELKSKEDVNRILERVKKDSFLIESIKKGTKKRNPYPPYITSTLQQDSSRKIGFTTKKTMIVAQQLYEGISIKGEGTQGLITYMRTDSTRLSKESVQGAKTYIEEKFGKKYSNGGNEYINRTKKDSQDAHEAIRPTLVARNPEDIKDSLTKDQYRLYKLIWERFIASQMAPAIYNTMAVTFTTNNLIFKTSGSTLEFEGFLKLYKSEEEEKDLVLPDLILNEVLKSKQITPSQHFTQPPPRYTEASLIKTLEELGIGRPSTFAPTIATILARGYVRLEKKIFYPTDLGTLVNDLLIEYFSGVINEEFSAKLEDDLDNIAEGTNEWKKVVGDFYGDFSVLLERAEDEIKEIIIEDEVSDEICEKCGRNMVIKHGRFGKFLACPGYPECKNTKAIVEKIDVECPKCQGDIILRKSKRGRLFYGCSNYPDCDFTSWDEPVKEKCPECNSMMVLKKSRSENIIKCTNNQCGKTIVKKI